jgi:hypothetical protein
VGSCRRSRYCRTRRSRARLWGINSAEGSGAEPAPGSRCVIGSEWDVPDPSRGRGTIAMGPEKTLAPAAAWLLERGSRVHGCQDGENTLTRARDTGNCCPLARYWLRSRAFSGRSSHIHSPNFGQVGFVRADCYPFPRQSRPREPRTSMTCERAQWFAHDPGFGLDLEASPQGSKQEGLDVTKLWTDRPVGGRRESDHAHTTACTHYFFGTDCAFFRSTAMPMNRLPLLPYLTGCTGFAKT